MKSKKKDDINSFLITRVSRKWLTFNAFFLIVYITIITFGFEVSNKYLFTALIMGQIFYLWQGLTFISTVWSIKTPFKRYDDFYPHVDIFITVAGEPVELVRETIRAAKKMDYPNFFLYVLNKRKTGKK